MSRQSGYVHVENCDIIAETDKAFLVVIDDGDESWLPKSQIKDAETIGEGDEGVTLTISKWLADEKGIEGEES